MTEAPSKTQIILARLVLVLIIGFVALGLAMYGFSAEVRARVWQNLIERPEGPMVFRFVLQPVMATIAALRDGIRDARTGRAPFLWTVLTNPAKRVGRLDEALIATARIILLGLVMDLIYQLIELSYFHPAEAVIVALVLAFLPYVLLRGVIARIARRWLGSEASGGLR
jgi:hypothetical protein